jgi:Leucine-rich repeat (LRR) protein
MPYLEDLIIDSGYKRKQTIPNSIANMNNLSFLRLGFSSHLELSEGFAKLSKLVTLKISTKKLLLPENFGELKNLRELDLRDCNIEFLPKTFDLLQNLETLYLEGNIHLELKDTFKKISKLPKLKFLRISAKEIPREIGLCKQLEKLELYNHPDYKNYITPLVLPEEIGNLTNLRHLDIEENHLEKLPKSIGKLKKLKYLSVSENQLEILPLEICNLTNLQELYLSKNKLTSLPEGFEKLKNLYYLDISGNMINKIPKELRFLKEFVY